MNNENGKTPAELRNEANEREVRFLAREIGLSEERVRELVESPQLFSRDGEGGRGAAT